MTPGWNFHKVLLGPGGEVAGSWGAATRPASGALARATETVVGG